MMLRLKKAFLALTSNEEGSTAVEYGLLAAVLVLGIAGALVAAADSTTGLYDYMVTTIQAALS